jgi:DNA-binding beta-propeller fold protein YncE
MHILPVVHRLEQRYANELVVIGVHSGKFTAERITENIRTATARLEITHPVVNDRQFRIWRSFNVSAWPTVVLISPDGQYMGQHAGEFSFEEFAPVIEEAVEVYSAEGMLDRTPLHFPPDPAPPVDSPLRFPGKVLADPAGGRLFIADTGHNRVLVARLTAGEGGRGDQAEVIHTIGSGTPGMQDGPFEQARLHHPEGMALVGHTLYIADKDNHAVRAADLPSGTVRTIAGNGRPGYDRRSGVGTRVALNSPWDLLERAGWLYIAMAGLHQIWRLNLSTGEVGPLVGSGRENIDDGPNPRATLAQPSGLATDGERLFFADSESSAVRVADFDPHGYTRTLLGQGLFEFGDRDGRAAEARLQHCLGVAYHQNRIYIADTYNNKIRVLDLHSMQIATAFGSGKHSELYEPGGVTIRSIARSATDIDAVVESSTHAHSRHEQGQRQDDGVRAVLYVADTNNHRVVRAAIGAEGMLEQVSPVTLRFRAEAARLPADEAFIGDDADRG